MFGDGGLAYSMWDADDGQTSGAPAAPPGFQGRDAVASQQQADLLKLKQGGSGPVPMPPAPSVAAAPPPPPPTKSIDVDITDTQVDLGSRLLPEKPADIGDYQRVSDLVYIFVAVLLVDVLVIFACRYAPEIFGSIINKWYDLFGLNAVIADVMIIVIGFMVARHVWGLWFKNKYSGGKWSPLKFTGLLVVVQMIHDLMFYYGVILPVPRGHNAMIDVFKDYAASGGWKILGADAGMMVLSAGLAMLFKSLPGHIVASTFALTSYALPYILYKKVV